MNGCTSSASQTGRVQPSPVGHDYEYGPMEYVTEAHKQQRYRVVTYNLFCCGASGPVYVPFLSVMTLTRTIFIVVTYNPFCWGASVMHWKYTQLGQCTSLSVMTPTRTIFIVVTYNPFCWGASVMHWEIHSIGPVYPPCL